LNVYRHPNLAPELLVVVLLAAACTAPAPTPSATLGLPSPSPTAAATATASPSPTPEPSCAERVLAGMSQAQRIGQLVLMGLGNNQLGVAELAAIRQQHVGSVWFTRTTSTGVTGVRAIADAVQAEATVAATDGVGFFVAANQEGGQVQAMRGAGFSTIPSALDQDAEALDVLQGQAQVWGAELLAAGVNLNFAPVFDVVPPGTDASNAPIGALEREYGHDPVTAGNAASAFASGMALSGVATTAKHFPGLGRVTANTDFAAEVVDTVTTVDDPYLDSFRTGIDAGVPFVMVALATYTQIDADHLAAFSPVVIGQLLRGDLGFEGVVMSDDLGATVAVASMAPGERAIQFLLAGGDLVVSRSAVVTVAMVAAVQARAATDAVFAARVGDAAFRVLEAKEAAGLLDC
jgi:beta-N-acetylhexosaminidase